MQKRILSMLVGLLLASTGFAQYGPHADQIFVSTNGWIAFTGTGVSNLQTLLTWMDSNLAVSSTSASTNWVQVYAACKTNSNTFTSFTTQSFYEVNVRDTLSVTTSATVADHNLIMSQTNVNMILQTGVCTNGGTNATFSVPFSSTSDLSILTSWINAPSYAETNHIHVMSYNATSFYYVTEAVLGGQSTSFWYHAYGRH